MIKTRNKNKNDCQHGQHMGFSNISIGDDGGKVKTFSHKPARATVRRNYGKHGQHHGAESTSTKEERTHVQQRQYPGGHSLTKANISITCVPPAFPHPKVRANCNSSLGPVAFGGYFF